LNYYERHIGDYLKDTAHLSILEHGAYGRLLDVYYTKESPIPAAQVARLIGARSKEELQALQVVLDEFFVQVGDAYTHTRCDREIARYKAKQDKAAASANARWGNDKSPPQKHANAMRTHSERIPQASANSMQSACDGHAPSNQTPVTSIQRAHVEHQQGGPDGPARADFESLKTEAGEAMRRAGIGDVSDTHPELLALLRQGMTVEELAAAAIASAAKGKGFAYALAKAAGKRQDAAAQAALPSAPPMAGSDPDSRPMIEADGLRLQMGAWQQVDAAGNTVTWPAYAATVQAARKAERLAALDRGVSA
jgi:uncharacterized protein YdaU (DUF1376 family)